MEGPAGSSISGTRSDGALGGLPNASIGIIASTGQVNANIVVSGHFTAVAPNGDVVSMSASAEVNDPAGACVFGVTAIGP